MTDSAENPVTLPVPPLPLVVKANLKNYFGYLGFIRVGLALGISIFFWTKFGFIAWIISVVGITALIVIILFILSRRSVTLDEQGVHTKNGLGLKKNATYQEISTAKVFINYVEPGFGVIPRVVIGRKNANQLASFAGLFWLNEDMDKMLAVLNDKKVTVEYYDEAVTSLVVTKEFPDYFLAYERHPYWFASIIVAVILVVGTIFVLTVM
ncbi:MAG: hypothetical protein WAQ27_05075 [Candidatus Microsaccharimonas sp.]